MPALVQARLLYKQVPAGSWEGVLDENCQVFHLYDHHQTPAFFTDGVEAPNTQWDELVLQVFLKKTSTWVKMYEASPIDPNRWLHDIAFKEARMGTNGEENLCLCPLMPRTELSKGTIQLFFEATPKGDDDQERRMQDHEVPQKPDIVSLVGPCVSYPLIDLPLPQVVELLQRISQMRR